MMVKPVREHFASMSEEPQMKVSPVLMNLLATPTPTSDPVQVDTLEREKDIKNAAECPKCPKHEECPDMSQYIRLDEIPCWNCSLP